MNPILLGACLGVLWGLWLIVDLVTPPKTLLHLPFGAWIILGIAFALFCASVSWFFGWLGKK